MAVWYCGNMFDAMHVQNNWKDWRDGCPYIIIQKHISCSRFLKNENNTRTGLFAYYLRVMYPLSKNSVMQE